MGQGLVGVGKNQSLAVNAEEYPFGGDALGDQPFQCQPLRFVLGK
jgi:hypothetical protein